MINYRIHITGRVQGVGFRPYVYNLAKSYELVGWVCNSINGLNLEVESMDDKTIKSFYNELLENPPELAVIKAASIHQGIVQTFKDFTIKESHNNGDVDMLLCPDFALCDSCRKELKEKNNKRKEYAFITCTKCGPRYSIMQNIPYDRKTTTMDAFQMCDSCQGEYEAIDDRRFYSQTNSCKSCPVLMTLWDIEQNNSYFYQKEIIELAREVLFEEGKILAVKGIGGFLLIADATNRETVERLRSRKRRNDKPFALMYPNLEVLKGDVFLSKNEESELKSIVSPIILARKKTVPNSNICSDVIAPGLVTLGVMLPYTGLYELLLRGQDKPIVATSGNISNAPIIYRDIDAFNHLSRIAEYIITNDRKIVAAQDDSIIRIAPKSKQKIILRRARGLSPSFNNNNITFDKKESILAFGADIKAGFSIWNEGQIYSSQYLGDLEDFQSQESYLSAMDHLKNLLRFEPKKVIHDLHPEYYSTRFANEIAQKNKIPTFAIQHHKAHFGAILSEHNLISQNEKVMGVIWDGIGYGEDGNIWGGEFFSYQYEQINRINHIAYFPYFLGNKMSKEPRISALAMFHNIKTARPILKQKFSNANWRIYEKLLSKDQELSSSSMGRVFDAVASMLGLSDHNLYEGYAATLLENLAQGYINRYGVPDPYKFEIASSKGIDISSVYINIVKDIRNKVKKGKIAAKFHLCLVGIIKSMALHDSFKKIAFSGGVFQNALLVDLIKTSLGCDYDLYFHKELSPNDENISFGQIACHEINLIKKSPKKAKYSNNNQPIDNYVLSNPR